MSALSLSCRICATEHPLEAVGSCSRCFGPLEPAYDLLKVAPNPIAIKAALNLLGFGVGGHRLPLVPATEDEIARVRDCLERAGLHVPAAA